MRMLSGKYRRRLRVMQATRRVALCGGLRDSASMGARNLRTADYSPEDRQRLGREVAKARRAAGHRWRPSFCRETGVKKRGLEAVELAEPNVGVAVLESIGGALGRYHQGWTVDTPRAILEGEDPPALGEGPPVVDTDVVPDPAADYTTESDGDLLVGSDEWLLKHRQHPDLIEIGITVRKKRREIEGLKRILAAREAEIAEGALPHSGVERS